MTAREPIKMVEGLEIPNQFVSTSWYTFTGLEAFCLLCAHFCSAVEMYSLSMLYDHSQSSISECLNELVEYIDNTWEHLLGCDEEHLQPSELAWYANAIHQCDAPIKTVCGFIDCTMQRIAHCTWWQWQTYHGHKKFHALKFWTLMLPNCIIGHL